MIYPHSLWPLWRTLTILLGLCIFTSCKGNRNAEADSSATAHVLTQAGKITIKPDSPFLKHLEIQSITRQKSRDQALMEVGQIIALANPTGELSPSQISWVELDPQLSQSLGFNFTEKSQFAVGTALGLSYLSREYASKIRPGETIRISRYGLRKLETSGSVLLTRMTRQSELIEVVFQLARGESWMPGTNCEIEFPMIQSQAIQIPATAIIHIGSEEYVIKEIAAGVFIPKNVTIIQETPTEITVTGGILPGDRIVKRGAILLKPEVQKLFNQEIKASYAQ